jgi:hypothetical protein
MDFGHQLVLILMAISSFYFTAKYSLEINHFQFASFQQYTSENPRTVSMSIHVFCWRRTKSLQRLCNSLLRARYLNYTVPIVFHVDGDPLPSVVAYLDSFEWPFGEKTIIQSPNHLGMPNVHFANLMPTNFSIL